MRFKPHKKKIKKQPKKAKRLRLPLNLFQKKIIKKLPMPQKSRTASQKVILNQKAIQKLKRSMLKKKSLRLKSRKKLCKKRMTIRLLKPPLLRLIAQSRLNVNPFSIIWTIWNRNTKNTFPKTESCLIIIKPRLKARAQFMICLKKRAMIKA